MDKTILGKYKLVLGMEIHLHVHTKRKMFCFCDADIYDAQPNTHTCPVCLGLPGALPVPNYEAIRKIQLLGLGFGCKLNNSSKFDRKHYFYPDLPKGYQISQYKEPFCKSDGDVIERIHLEEDTAKSLHEGDKTLIDFNMSSMPLIEIVTKPVFNDVDDAVVFCKKVQQVVRDLRLGDVDMQKGQMRLEPNISLRTEEMEKNGELPKYKVEIKNINSFKFMEKAVLAEIVRQKAILESGETPAQENRGFNEATNSTVSQRSKEDAHDYRYFPEPDIPPMFFDDAYMSDLKKEFDEIVSKSPSHVKQNLLISFDIDENLKTRLADFLDVSEIERLVELNKNLGDTKKLSSLFLSNKKAATFSDEEIKAVLEKDKVSGMESQELEKIVKKVLSENQEAVEKYKKGNEKVLMFIVGQIMRETKGKATAEQVTNSLKISLK